MGTPPLALPHSESWLVRAWSFRLHAAAASAARAVGTGPALRTTFAADDPVRVPACVMHGGWAATTPLGPGCPPCASCQPSRASPPRFGVCAGRT